MTSPERVSEVFVSEMGFLPEARRKLAYVLPAPPPGSRFSVVAVGNVYISGGSAAAKKVSPLPTVLEGQVASADGPFGTVGVADLSELRQPGLYQVVTGAAQSLPFWIRRDLYVRHAYETFYFSHIQRCGCEVPGWHAACHLDDARRRDTGRHVDTVGGWHDAGDLRKWMIATLWQAVGMIWVKRRWNPTWNQYADDDILDELRWGNLYFHKMLDPATGLVWNDVGGGVDGDNSDNHWTDNVVGTCDDRYLNVGVSPAVQYEFVWVQAMAAQVFSKYADDPAYGQHCLNLARRAWAAGTAKWPLHQVDTTSLGYAALAACELFRHTHVPADADVASSALAVLLARQETSFVARQSQYRGFFYDGPDRAEIFKQVWQSGVLPLALLTADEVLGGDIGRQAADAFCRYADEFLLPLSRLSAFAVLPYGVFLRPQTHDVYRPLAGALTYRFFLPCRTSLEQPDAEAPWWLGPTSHVLGHAAALLWAARRFARPEFRDLALRQMEWLSGANPIGANGISGRGLGRVWPHSRYVGIIPGAVMNAVSGTRDDQPVFGPEHLHWQTTEYWSPHQATYLMCLAELHDRYDLGTDIGVAIKAAPHIAL